MSQENVEIARRAFDAVNRRDLETLDALWSEDSEFHSVLAASEGRVFRGHQGIREYFAWFDESFTEFGSEVEEIIEAGEDRVVVLYTFRARGKASGVRLDQRGGLVITYQDEQITRMDSHFDPAEALKAAGLSE